MPEFRKTLCNRDCPDTCGIVATVDQGRITQLKGDPDHPITQGFLCYRTAHFLETQYAADRVLSPLLKNAKGEFVPISWDEALDLIARRLVEIRSQSGPASIFHYRSGGSLGLLKAATDLFFNCFGPVTEKRGDICSGAGDEAQMIDFGEEDSNDLFDLLNAKNIILWGKNAIVSSPHTVPVLREAKARGAGLVLIDPVYHKTASFCDSFYQIKPAADFALAMAVAQILFENHWIDHQAPSYCDHFDEFRAMAYERSVERYCEEADLPVSAALDIARRLGPGKPTAILVGWGMGRRSQGGAIVRALDALCAVSGNIGIRGGGVSFYFKRRRAFQMPKPKNGESRPAPRTVCEPLFGEEVLAMREPPIRALWVTAGNPVAMLPDSARVAEAIRSREFVVVVDSFLTDTAKLATIVLPTTTLLEDDDIIGAYGHHYIGVSQPVISRPESVRTDLEIIQALAKRVGLEEEMAGTPREWKQRFLNPSLSDYGITLDMLEQGVVRNPLSPRVLFADKKFPTKTGRVNLICDAPSPVREEDANPSGEYPLQLMALSTDKAQSSQWAKPQNGPATVTVHPEAVPHLPDGALCRVESRMSALVARVKHDARQRRDVAIMPKGGHWDKGQCANALIQAKLTDLGEGGALYEEYVRIVPAEG